MNPGRPGPERQTSRLALLLAGLLLEGCADPLDTPSAYTTQRFLCTEDRQAEWQALIAECEAMHSADGSCGGVASFRGVLQGQPYVVESLLDECSVQDVVLEDGSLLRNVVSLFGSSPYFGFRIYMEAFGGVVVEPGVAQQPRELRVVSRESMSPLYDDQATVELRINTRGASLELGSRSGDIAVTQQTTELQDLRVSAELVQGGTLDGCFHGVLTSRSVSAFSDE